MDPAMGLNHLDQHLLDRVQMIKKDLPTLLYWLKPCPVKILLVTDGGLDYSMRDFGLSAFVDCLLNENRFYARFNVTLAHLRADVSDEQMAGGTAGIVRRIKEFRFDDPSLFSNALYDQVWLFGIETYYNYPLYYPYRTGHGYPADGLAQSELDAITTFMDNKGGLFATGDHGSLGKGLCGKIPRARSMRYWNNTTTPPETDDDEVSMTGARRNDTNKIGRDSNTQFSDQSDDIPQTIQPKFYYARRNAFTRERYPHPLLCSSLGLIDVLPDHPHEGQCVVPTTANELADYPGGILPEVIAMGSVPSGNTGTIHSSPKHPTIAHSFGVIGAYDGHRANKGRIVTDSTWHHFINVNLIGLVNNGSFDDLSSDSSEQLKLQGFMSSPQGRDALAKIKEYYLNIVTWISPPALIQCFNTKFIYKLLYTDRVMESALIDPNVKFDMIRPDIFYSIGIHAKDVLGRTASTCATLQFILDIVKIHLPEMFEWMDPWNPKIPVDKEATPLPVVDLGPVTSVMLGVLLVKLRQENPYPTEKLAKAFFSEKFETLTRTAATGIEIGIEHSMKETSALSDLFGKSLKRIKEANKKGKN